MIIPKLDFTSDNNSALSLRTLAEFCRRGDAKVIEPEQAGPNDVIVVVHFNGPAPRG